MNFLNRIEARECLVKALFTDNAKDINLCVNGLVAALTLGKDKFLVSEVGTRFILEYIEKLEEKVTDGSIVGLSTYCDRCRDSDISIVVQPKSVEDKPCQKCKGTKYVKIWDKRKTVVSAIECPDCR